MGAGALRRMRLVKVVPVPVVAGILLGRLSPAMATAPAVRAAVVAAPKRRRFRDEAAVALLGRERGSRKHTPGVPAVREATGALGPQRTELEAHVAAVTERALCEVHRVLGQVLEPKG